MFIPFLAQTDREWQYRQSQPWLVYGLLLAYAAVHTYLATRVDPAAWTDLIYRFGVVRYQPNWYSFLTCTFLHAGWLHLIGNCFFLWLYGAALEKLLGTWRFALLYTAGAFLSVAVHVLTLSAFYVDVPTIGASGAISAVLGAFFVLLPTAKMRCLLFFFLRPIVVTVPAFVVLGVWFVGQLYYSIEPITSSESIAFWAHLAGFASGTGIGTLLYRQMVNRMHKREHQAVAPVAAAWAAVAGGEFARAARLHQPYASQTANAACDDLLVGVLASEVEHNTTAVAAALLRSFSRAANALDSPGQVTAYLQMTQRLAATLIPPFVHRDAGVAAISCGTPALGLEAFARAVDSGATEGLDLVFQRTEAVLRHKFGMAAEADRIRDLAARLARGG